LFTRQSISKSHGAEGHFAAALVALDQPVQPTSLTLFERAEIQALAMAALDRGQEATAVFERAISKRSGADVFQRQHYELFSTSGPPPGISAIIAIWRDIIASDNSAVGPRGGRAPRIIGIRQSAARTRPYMGHQGHEWLADLVSRVRYAVPWLRDHACWIVV